MFQIEQAVPVHTTGMRERECNLTRQTQRTVRATRTRLAPAARYRISLLPTSLRSAERKRGIGSWPGGRKPPVVACYHPQPQPHHFRDGARGGVKACSAANVSQRSNRAVAPTYIHTFGGKTHTADRRKTARRPIGGRAVHYSGGYIAYLVPLFVDELGVAHVLGHRRDRNVLKQP